MPNDDLPDFVATDLPLTLYLNQRLAFDLLAVLNGGLSRFSTVQTVSTNETATNSARKAELGVSNVFAFLGVNFGAQNSQQDGQKASESKTEEFVHTPASLFARLRNDLKTKELVRYVDNSENLEGLQASEFVEFEATLRRSPLIEMLDAITPLMAFVDLADDYSSETANTQSRRSGKSRNRKSSQKHNEFSEIMKIINLLKTAVSTEGSQDLIAEMNSLRIVLTTENDYFIDPSMNDIIDGTFRVFGKVTRIVNDESDKISLLRKSAAGKFEGFEELLDPLMISMQDVGFNGPLESEISGPTMQVIPIAIFS